MRYPPKIHRYVQFIALLVIGLGCGLVFYLSHVSSSQHESEYVNRLNHKNYQIEETTTQANVAQNATKKTYKDEYHPNDEKLSKLIEQIETKQVKTHLLKSQKEINDLITQLKKDPKELGYLYLPDRPAKSKEIESNVKQIDVPLILQKDPRWREIEYGSNHSKQLGENGCAIVSLAMVESYLSNKNVSPKDILKWSGQRYYMNDQGTSWNIFYDYALKYDHEFMNYGNDFYSAMESLDDGKIVIASVNPGFFTSVGHIIVIRGYQDGKVYVNDPNDDPSKMFSIKPIDQSVLLQEGVNYWSFSKK